MQLHTQAHEPKNAGLSNPWDVGTRRGGSSRPGLRGDARHHASATSYRIAFTLLEMLGERTNINKFWGFCVLAPIFSDSDFALLFELRDFVPIF